MCLRYADQRVLVPKKSKQDRRNYGHTKKCKNQRTLQHPRLNFLKIRFGLRFEHVSSARSDSPQGYQGVLAAIKAGLRGLSLSCSRGETSSRGDWGYLSVAQWRPFFPFFGGRCPLQTQPTNKGGALFFPTAGHLRSPPFLAHRGANRLIFQFLFQALDLLEHLLAGAP